MQSLHEGCLCSTLICCFTPAASHRTVCCKNLWNKLHGQRTLKNCLKNFRFLCKLVRVHCTACTTCWWQTKLCEWHYHKLTHVNLCILKLSTTVWTQICFNARQGHRKGDWWYTNLHLTTHWQGSSGLHFSGHSFSSRNFSWLWLRCRSHCIKVHWESGHPWLVC